MTRIRILLDVVNASNLVPTPNRVAWSYIFWFRTGNVKTKFYMHVQKRLYSTHVPNFIPTGTCLVPLFDCPYLVPNYDPDSRTLIPGFKVSRLKEDETQV